MPLRSIYSASIPGLFVFLACSWKGAAQSEVPRHLFRSPVDFPISLSGSYGEFRSDHFHSGIDIRTGGQMGKPVYAAADGTVSRIYVSPWGFGKAVYIEHPAGFTTVYAHLGRFTGKIARYTREQQYAKESFSLDISVPAGTIPVRKGEVIGFSGDSGSAGGPHLHFEIRDSRTQEPLDPVSFGIPVQDRLKPQIRWVKIYPADGWSMINFANRPQMFRAVGDHGSYGINPGDTIWVSGNIIFGIESYDYHDGSSIRCGIKSVELRVDDRKVFTQDIERFAFSETRYANAILDYPQNRQNGQRILRSYVAPGNQLNVFRDVVNRGIVTFVDTQPHRVQYLVKDVQGNTARLSFWVKSHPPPPVGARPGETVPAGNTFPWDRANHFDNGAIRFEMPARALYEDMDFRIQSSPPLNGTFAPVYAVGNEDVPLHLRCTLSIRAETLPRSLEGKALVVKVDKNGKMTSQRGTFREGYVTAQIREFGKYTVTVDTVAPKIQPVNIYPGKNIGRQNSLIVKISDELSGIHHYRGTLNGEWILMDFDPKRDQLVYTFDDRMNPGKNRFHLVVTDGVGNKSEYSATLTR